MTHVTSPRRTSHRRASRSVSTSRWRRTAPSRAPRAIANLGRLLEPLLGGEPRHLRLERFGDERRIAAQGLGGGSHGAVVRRAVGDPGARALGDTELGRAARNGVG